jgi:hypothetical protein
VAEGRQRNRGFFSDLVRRVSNPREGPKILTFLFRSRVVRSSYISEAGGRGVLRSSQARSSRKLHFRFLSFYELRLFGR